MNNIFSKLRIKAIKIIFLVCPKIIITTGACFFSYVRSLILRQLICDKVIINFSQRDKHIFFGYYDINPFDKEDKLLLAMKTPLITKTPSFQDEAEIGFYNLRQSKHEFHSVGKTNTWCWQQGCRLQWYSGKKDQIVYNCLVDGKLGSVIKEIPSGKIVKKIKKPLYSISRDGKWGLSLDFSRLQRLRPGYGYGIFPDKSENDPKPDYNGIELINIETGECSQLFTLKKIAEIESVKSMNSAEHYFNHLMFNPSGSKFLFFHLWTKTGERSSRVFVADKNGKNLKLLNNSGSVSHYNWISEDEIILYSLIKERNKYLYAIFNSSDGKIRFFGENVPKKDGHPTFLRSRETFITDTYPDLLFQRNLLSYNIKKDKIQTLARFDSPINFTGEFRCDLHPRISNNEKMICVDRIIDGKRSISLIPYKD